ncbi:MAG: hypothetical protein ABI480_18610 [Chitinophagaceae bacterium]
MKKIIALSSIFLLTIYACNNADKQAGKSENDVDAARNFIQAGLDHNYDKARTYMLQDKINQQRMDAAERIPMSDERRKGLAGASINIHSVNKINDTSTIVIFSNSYVNKWDTLRVVKQNDNWLVDFNYYFTHGADTSLAIPLLKDSTNK